MDLASHSTKQLHQYSTDSGAPSVEAQYHFACWTQGFLVQMQAAKLGVVTGKNLAELCR